MNRRNALIGLAAAVAGLGIPSAGEAKTKVIVVETAPPAIREEPVPPARKDYVWASGHWRWNGHEYVWVKGHWVKVKHGHHWVPDRWHEKEKKWYFEVGHWDRD